jgi:hypothetical protein
MERRVGIEAVEATCAATDVEAGAVGFSGRSRMSR